jgi:hypothetical protein
MFGAPMATRPIESLTIEAPTLKEAIVKLYRALHDQPVPDEWLTELITKIYEEAAVGHYPFYIVCNAEGTMVSFLHFVVLLPVVEARWWIDESSESGSSTLQILLYEGVIRPLRSTHIIWSP